MNKLDDVKWGQVHLSEIFSEISRGKIADLRNIKVGNTIIVAAAGTNEGFSCFSDDEAISSNSMTISFNGVGTGTAFVHNYPFNLNYDCGLVKTKIALSLNVLRFIAVSINQNKNKFHYGYKANESRLLRQTILLPITEDGSPNYEYMEKYIVNTEQLKVGKYKDYCIKELDILGGIEEIPNLCDVEWQAFYVKKIFEKPQRGKRIVDKNHIEGVTPLVSSYGQENGVTHFIGNEDKVRKFTNCLSIANGGSSAGKAFYHPYTFVATDHVTQCWNANLNQYQYLFLATVMTKALTGKYSFSHEISDPRLAEERIMLPALPSSEPDYKYMEQYIKNKLIKKYQSYLDYIEKK